MTEERISLTESASKKILAEYSIEVIPGDEAADPEEALRCAEVLGYPVVLKISHPAVTHKSDTGGVILNVEAPEAVRAGAERLLAVRPGAKVRVEKQAGAGGIDLILGFKRDPVFGPIVMAGMGGVFTEILADRRLHAGTLDEHGALSMIEGLKGYAMLKGARGQDPLDCRALAAALVGLWRIARARPDIVEMDINPFRLFRQGGAALDALAVTQRLSQPSGGERLGPEIRPVRDAVHSFFNPAAVAVVGPSRTTEKAGNIIIQNLKILGFRGAVYPVNPNGGTIEGLRSYPAIADCPGPVDLAVLATPYHQVRKVAEDAAAAGTGSIIAVAGGFSDAGEEGRRLEEALTGFCRSRGIRLMGPNSIGTLDCRSGFTTAIIKVRPAKPTGISLFGQTGTLSTGFFLEEITRRGRGFSKVACLGNKADVDECDLLEYAADDPGTGCIGLYLEGVKNGSRFLEAAAKAARSKPVVVLKAGRTGEGARTAASHTGSMAGSDDIYAQVFHQTGLQRAEGFSDFFDILRGFDLCPAPAGGRIGIVSMTGVGCVLAADACSANGLPLAPVCEKTRSAMKALVPGWAPISNPADIWSTIEQRGPFESFREMCGIMIRDEAVDILIVITVLIDEGAFDAAAVLEPLRSEYPGKPVLFGYVGGSKENIEAFQTSLEPIGVPVCHSPERAVKVASYLHQREKIKARLHYS
jgi:acyl-CoA synthetase (NDP forming)